MTDEMFVAAARALAEFVTPERFADGGLYPPVTHLRAVSSRLALAVATEARRAGVAGVSDDVDLAAAVEAATWDPRYVDYLTEPTAPAKRKVDPGRHVRRDRRALRALVGSGARAGGPLAARSNRPARPGPPRGDDPGPRNRHGNDRRSGARALAGRVGDRRRFLGPDAGPRRSRGSGRARSIPSGPGRRGVPADRERDGRRGHVVVRAPARRRPAGARRGAPRAAARRDARGGDVGRPRRARSSPTSRSTTRSTSWSSSCPRTTTKTTTTGRRDTSSRSTSWPASSARQASARSTRRRRPSSTGSTRGRMGSSSRSTASDRCSSRSRPTTPGSCAG